jgi:hypothetical protein
MNSTNEKKAITIILRVIFIAFMLMMLACMVFGCRQANARRTVMVPDTVYVHDTVMDTTNISILNGLLSNRIGKIEQLTAMNRMLMDSVAIYRRRRAYDDDNRAALIQIREYNALCRKNPTLKKYLSGWINRALAFAHYEADK